MSVDTTTSTRARREFIAAQQRALDRYGVDACSRFVDTPVLGGDAHVLVAGDGPPVLMVIGGGMVAGLWAPLMARLRGFTLYAVDPPGHGLSAGMHYGSDTIRSMGVRFLADVMDGLGLEEAPFVAQSMGGLMATWLALEHPARVTSITYVGCPAIFLDSSAPFPLRLSTIPWVASLIDRIDPPSPKQVIRMGRMAGEDLSGLPELRDLFVAYERIPGAITTLHRVHRALIRVRGPRPDVRVTEEQLAELQPPIQMIWGDQDPFGPPSVGRRVAGVVPGALLHVLPAGHGPWFSQSAAVAALIEDFIGRDG